MWTNVSVHDVSSTMVLLVVARRGEFVSRTGIADTTRSLFMSSQPVTKTVRLCEVRRNLLVARSLSFLIADSNLWTLYFD